MDRWRIRSTIFKTFPKIVLLHGRLASYCVNFGLGNILTTTVSLSWDHQ